MVNAIVLRKKRKLVNITEKMTKSLRRGLGLFKYKSMIGTIWSVTWPIFKFNKTNIGCHADVIFIILLLVFVLKINLAFSMIKIARLIKIAINARVSSSPPVFTSHSSVCYVTSVSCNIHFVIISVPYRQ
jgi:hypothetical protein